MKGKFQLLIGNMRHGIWVGNMENAIYRKVKARMKMEVLPSVGPLEVLCKLMFLMHRGQKNLVQTQHILES